MASKQITPGPPLGALGNQSENPQPNLVPSKFAEGRKS